MNKLNIPSGVSIESASYMENNNLKKMKAFSMQKINEEIYSKTYFLKNKVIQKKIIETNDQENETEQLFDQDINEEEDFEIPAFLRKQKF